MILGAVAAIAAMWVGLLFSFSQSSFTALIAGVIVAAVFAWRRRAVALVAVAAAVFVLVAVAAPNVRHAVLHHADGGLNRVTSGRSKLVSNGVKIAVHHPVVGVGVGGFRHAYAKQAHLPGKEPKAAASHDTPITVAAETGVLGLGLFAWFLVVALVLAFRRVDRDLVGRAALVFGLTLTAIGVHSLFYNAFFEDPTVWGVLGLAAVAARTPLAGEDERAQAPELDREVEPEGQQDQRVDGDERHRARERDVERLPEHR